MTMAVKPISQQSGKKSGANVYTDWIHRGLADLRAGVKKTPTVERMIREAAAAKGIA